MDCCCWEGRGGVRNGGETKVDRVLDTDHSKEEHRLLLLGREGRGKEWGRDKS